ncbi:MAG: ECF transporter S component [Ruminococcaceae bacterium]|nr:ECF transporter S component [Oscillospiraceae bacterium]
MKFEKAIPGAIGTGVGIVGAVITRHFAIAANAGNVAKILYALSLICVILGIIGVVIPFLPKREKVSTKTLVLASMFAALCYIGFTFFKIDIPVGTEKTAFHLGNVFCVLAALLLGGLWGGMAGAVGMTIADLTTAYVTSAPKTFLLKLCIGLIVGWVAHKIFKISRKADRKIPLPVAAAVSCSAGMLFNVVADPIVGYFYKTCIMGVPQDAALIWMKIGALTTLVNAVIAVAAATLLYLALRSALERDKLVKDA